MNIFKIVIASWCMLYTTVLFAQKLDPTSQNILDKSKAIYQNSKSLKIVFDYSLNNSKENVSEKQKGVALSVGNKYKLSIGKMEQLFDGAKLYTIYSDDKEVTVSVPGKDKEELLNPTKVFNSFTKGFNISKYAVKQVAGANCQVYQLTPTNTASKTKSIFIAINLKNYELVQVNEINKNETVTSITIRRFVKDNAIPASTFQFNKDSYKGYMITEL